MYIYMNIPHSSQLDNNWHRSVSLLLLLPPGFGWVVVHTPTATDNTTWDAHQKQVESQMPSLLVFI